MAIEFITPTSKKDALREVQSLRGCLQHLVVQDNTAEVARVRAQIAKLQTEWLIDKTTSGPKTKTSNPV